MGEIDNAERNQIDGTEFAFPAERKAPLTDAEHVRNAIARFDQVKGVSESERSQAWKRIKAAANKFDVDVQAGSWRELVRGAKPSKRRSSR